MSPLLLVALMAGMLGLNFLLWKRRGRGWQGHVDDFKAVVQPHVPEPVVDVLVLQPAGSVGRQARAEQGRGLRWMVGGAGGELSEALADHRAEQDAAGDELPPMVALAVCGERRYLLPVRLANGSWTAGPVQWSWARGEAAYVTSPRSLTIQVTIRLLDGSWTGEYEIARDPAGYSAGVLARLAADG